MGTLSTVVVVVLVAFGMIWSQVGYSTVTRGGARDFASVKQIVATKYEVLAEHAHVARELLQTMPQHART